MTTNYVILLSAAFAVVSLLAIARAGVPKISSERELAERILPVDLTALANLYDPEQINYVRSRLTTREFAKYERERGRILIEYVKRISRNSALLIGFSHYIESTGVSSIAGDLLVLALKVRLKSFLTLCLLYFKTLFPSASIKLDGLIFNYRLAMVSVPETDPKAT